MGKGISSARPGEKSVQAGQDFYQLAKSLESPHRKSRVYHLLNTIEAAGYSDVQAVKDFRLMLDNEDKDGLKELDAHYAMGRHDPLLSVQATQVPYKAVLDLLTALNH